MVKSLGLFPIRVANPIEVRFVKGKLQVAGQVVGNVRSSARHGKGKKVLPSAR